MKFKIEERKKEVFLIEICLRNYILSQLQLHLLRLIQDNACLTRGNQQIRNCKEDY